MSCISCWLLLVSIILQISNFEMILYLGLFLYTLYSDTLIWKVAIYLITIHYTLKCQHKCK